MDSSEKTLYNTDFYRWTQQQVDLLKTRPEAVDQHRLAHELRQLAQEAEHELQKRFAVLLTDLLVWQYEYDFRSYPQKCRIESQRSHIRDFLNKHPSITSIIPQLFSTAYDEAVYETALRTHYWFTDFHVGQWTVDDVLDNQFWPELWPIHAKQDGLNDLRKQPWFVQEIRRAIDANETPDYPPFALKKAL